MLATNLILLVCACNLLNRSKLGRAIRAVAQNRRRCDGGCERQPGFCRCLCHWLSPGAAAGFVGSLTALYPSMSGDLVLKGFAVMILGGMGSVPGAVLGGVIIGLTESLGGALISSAYKNSFGFVVLILVLLIKPSGIFGKDV
ncbi:MAG: branched-chain amino acid ABC transporter permease [Betaproteobacteria bacterium]|nr:branched-chain amino acid ABC transporter permease [Betaproteobacteria bacterium]